MSIIKASKNGVRTKLRNIDGGVAVPFPADLKIVNPDPDRAAIRFLEMEPGQPPPPGATVLTLQATRVGPGATPFGCQITGTGTLPAWWGGNVEAVTAQLTTDPIESDEDF